MYWKGPCSRRPGDPPGRGVSMGRGACPSPDELARLLGDGLDVNERGRVSDHVEGCVACQGRLDALLADDTVAAWTRSAETLAEPGPDEVFLSGLRELVT